MVKSRLVRRRYAWVGWALSAIACSSADAPTGDASDGGDVDAWVASDASLPDANGPSSDAGEGSDAQVTMLNDGCVIVRHPLAELRCADVPCEAIVAVSLRCPGFNNGSRIALTDDAAYVYVGYASQDAMYVVDESNVEREAPFPFAITMLTAMRAPYVQLATDRAGTVIAHGDVDQRQSLGFRDANGWTTESTDTAMVMRDVEVLRTGQPIVIGRQRAGSQLAKWEAGTTTALNWLTEPLEATLDGDGDVVVVGRDHGVLTAAWLDGTKQTLTAAGAGVLARLPALGPDDHVTPLLAHVLQGQTAVSVEWVDRTGTVLIDLPNTETVYGTCKLGGLSPPCDLPCEQRGVETTDVAATRDQWGDLYVAYVRKHVDQTISATLHQNVCIYEPSRDDSRGELIVVRVDAGTTATRTVFVRPKLPRRYFTGLTARATDLAITTADAFRNLEMLRVRINE